MNTVLNVTASSGVTLVRQDAKADKSDDKKSDPKDEVKDTIDLGVGLDVAERLRNASDTDDLASLLQEGQDEARANIAKFKALLNEGQGGGFQDKGDQLFEAVRKTVVDILSEQRDEQNGSASKLSFEMRLSLYLKQDGVSLEKEG